MYKSFRWTWLIFTLLTAGCSHPAPIVGTWAGTQPAPQGVTLRDTWTFTADGRNTTIIQPTGGPYSGRAISSGGTYTADGGTMTQTISGGGLPPHSC